MKIEKEKIIHSSLKCEYDIRVKEKTKVYGFILYEYHDEYTESDKWYLAFVGTYTKFTKPEDRPNITYFGGKPGCEFEEETTYENYNETLMKMLDVVKYGEIC